MNLDYTVKSVFAHFILVTYFFPSSDIYIGIVTKIFNVLANRKRSELIK